MPLFLQKQRPSTTSTRDKVVPTSSVHLDARYMELAAHPSLIAVAQRVIGGRTEPELNASSVPLENQLRLNDANGVVVEPGNRNGYWHCGKCGRSHGVF